MSETLQRITALHAWYTRNVMAMRQTPEVERLWLEWLKAGYTGPDLRDVIRYIRRQISLGRRNEGALKLSNLLARSETGFLKFDEDLGLARARANLRPDRPLEAAPESNFPEARSQKPEVRSQSPLTDPQRAAMAGELAKLRQTL